MIGKDREVVMVEGLVVEEENKALMKGLWSARREAWVGRWNPSLETNQRSGACLEQT